MGNIWTIARREYNHYFSSPIAYVFMFVIFVVMGLIFWLDILYTSQSQQYSPFLPQLFNLYIFPLLFIGIPALTMRSLSEEYRSGTLELLMTSPLRDWQLIIGKWFGIFLFLMTMTVVTLVYPAILNSLVTPGIDLKSLATNYLGVTLFISAVSALGVAISSFFSNQIAALFATVGGLLFFYIVSWPAQLVQGATSDILTYLGIPSHFSNFMTGIIRVDDITFFISLTILSLVIGAAAIESRRWR
jgi:ABC-2 type transport system permease protein